MGKTENDDGGASTAGRGQGGKDLHGLAPMLDALGHISQSGERVSHAHFAETQVVHGQSIARIGCAELLISRERLPVDGDRLPIVAPLLGIICGPVFALQKVLAKLTVLGIGRKLCGEDGVRLALQSDGGKGRIALK